MNNHHNHNHPSSHHHPSPQWTAHIHSDGRTYYYDRTTGTSSWTPPPGFDISAPIGAPIVSDSFASISPSHDSFSSANSLTNTGVAATGWMEPPSRMDIKDLLLESEKSQEENARLVAELDNQRRRVSELEDERTTLTEQCQRLQNEIETALEGAREKEDANALIIDIRKELQEVQSELEVANNRSEEMKRELFVMKQMAQAAADFMVAARSNVTALSEDLSMARLRLSESERELCDAFEEIGALEDELRHVAEASIKKMRSSSLRSLLGYFSPLISRRKSADDRLIEGYASRKAAAKKAVSRRELTYNLTVALMRENLTAMSLAVEHKDLLLGDLAEELDQTREALAASSDLTESLRRDKKRLEEEKDALALLLKTRDDDTLRLAESLADVRVMLALSQDSLARKEVEAETRLLEARREAAILVLLEREEFAQEMRLRDEAEEALRDSNMLLLAELKSCSEALGDAEANTDDATNITKKSFFSNT